MSSAPQHQPRHRAPAARRAPRQALRTSLTLSAMAVVGTGLAVSAGAMTGPDVAPTSAALTTAAANDALVTEAGATDTAPLTEPQVDLPAVPASRSAVVSRSDRRAAADPAKSDLLDVGAATPDNALTRTEDLSDEDPRTIARALLAEFGFGADQFGCLDSLWTRESNWTVNADNPSSSAYGIPQALPGSKMSSAGSDWATNPVTQIRWGLGYIEDRYGSPCSAWGHSQSRGWY